MQYERIWAMPNKRTFSIKPIKFFIAKHTPKNEFFTKVDLFPYPYKRDSLERINEIEDESVDFLLYDPIYSRRQQMEMYTIKGTNYKDHPTYFKVLEREIFRVMKHEGIVLKFGWNSKSLPGFEVIDGRLIPHGGQHNDTICTAYIKRQVTLRGKR